MQSWPSLREKAVGRKAAREAVMPATRGEIDTTMLSVVASAHTTMLSSGAALPAGGRIDRRTVASWGLNVCAKPEALKVCAAAAAAAAAAPPDDSLMVRSLPSSTRRPPTSRTPWRAAARQCRWPRRS